MRLDATLDQKPVDAVSDEELRRLIKACAGNGVRDRRDRAMVMLFRDTGLRASELLALDVTDVNLVACIAQVRRGKGRAVRAFVSAAMNDAQRRALLRGAR